MKSDQETLALTTRTFPAHSSAVSRVRQYLRNQAAEARVEKEATDDLVLAVTEAWTNSLRHARTDWIDVTVYLLNDRVEVWVRDDGLFRQRIPLRGLELEGGHGVPLMMALMDEVHITKGIPRRPGTIVRLVRYR